MKTKATVVVFGVVGALLMNTAPAAAQIKGGSNEVHVYGGELFGDKILDRNVSGKRPELDDDVTFGLRYGYNFVKAIGIEVSVGYSPNQVTKLATSDIDLNVSTADVDAVWNITPDSKIVAYVLGGGGYGQASLDRSIKGTVSGRNVTIKDDNGFTANAGVGAKIFVTDSLMVRVEGRYRYMDKLVDKSDDSLNTVETTAGIGWRL